MSENTNSPAGSGSEREPASARRTHHFKQLNEENQLAVIDFILSLLK